MTALIKIHVLWGVQSSTKVDTEVSEELAASNFRV
jgi:hypothetical protein